MAFTYDLSTDVGRIRRTIPDKDEDEAFWTDEELESFLADAGNNWRRATAIILETMAADDLIVLKVMEVQNVTVSADRVMAAMLKRAQRLREDATEEENNAGDAFDSAEVVVTEHQWNERIWNQRQRGVL